MNGREWHQGWVKIPLVFGCETKILLICFGDRTILHLRCPLRNIRTASG